MTSIIINMVQDADMWPAKIALPYRFTESEMEIVWDELIFNNHLLGPVPEEGVSRLVTQQSTERRDHYTRYGIAFLLEHGFMRTPKGRTCYQMNLMQIRNAILETVYLGVIEAYLRSKMHGQTWNKAYGMQARSGPMLRGQLAQEVDDFMAVQKNEHGVNPDLWILPEGVKIYLATARPENNQYLLLGPGAGEAYKSALNGKDGDFLDKRNDCSIVESKTFEVPGVDQPVDPLSREVTVGEYNTMFDTVSSVLAPSEYRSAMRDIIVYDEAKDGFVKISLRAALAHCCRFNERGLLHWPTDDWPTDPDHRDDMFIHRLKDGTYRPCTLFGDMSPEALTTEGLRLMGESVKTQAFKMTFNADAFMKGIELCKRTADSPITAAELVGAPYSGFAGAGDLPAWQGAGLPKGYLSYSGLKKYCANPQTNDQFVAKNFLDQVDILHDALRALFPRSRVFDPSAASSWIYKASSHDTFFENCVFGSGLPIWVATATGAAIPLFTTVVPALEQTIDEVTFGAIIDASQNSSDRKTALKKAVKVLVGMTPATARQPAEPTVQNAEENLAAMKELILGVLSSPLAELNSGNNETASKFVRVLNSAVGELDDMSQFKVATKLVYNLYRYRVSPLIKDLASDDEKHFNAMYAMHRLLSKVAGDTLQPIIETLHIVAKVFEDGNLPAQIVAFVPGGSSEIIQEIDSIYRRAGGGALDAVAASPGTNNAAGNVAALVTFTAAARFGSPGPLGKDRAGQYYYRTRFTAFKLDALATTANGVIGAILAVHPSKPEFNAQVLHNANALSGITPGNREGPAALFGAFGGGHHGGGGGHHDGRPMPPAFAHHHKSYHDEEEHGGDEPHAQRRRGGFMMGAAGEGAATFGAPAYIRYDGTRVDSWEEAPRPGTSGQLRGMPPGRGRRLVPMDETGRLIDDVEDQARLARRTREIAAEQSLDGDLSDNYIDRYDYVLASGDPISRAAQLAFLACPIYRGVLENLIDKDVVFPFGFLLMRPFVVHNMATAILTKKGAETGETLIGHADFQLGDDIARKMHYGHYTMYLKSIVYRQDNVFLAQNIYCQNYVSGNDTTFMGWHNLVNDNAPKGSIYSILQPFGSTDQPMGEPFVPTTELPNPMDISGRFNTSAPHLVQLDDSNGSNGRLHYANASYYRHLWRWHNNAVDSPDAQGWVYGRVNQYNTLVFQGHQGMYNPASKNYDNIQINTGHFGPRVYPGCGLVRRGMQKTLENVSYSSPHGITRNVTGIQY